MKILFISAFPPCQKTAGQDYTRRLINEMVLKGYEVSLIYFTYKGHEIEIPDTVKVLNTKKACYSNCLKKIFFHPFFTKRFDIEILNQINKIANSFDMLYFDFSQVHIYSLYIKHENKVLMCHDVIAQKYTRKHKYQLPFIKMTENKLLKTAKNIITFSKKDSNYILNTYHLKSIPVNFYLKNGNFIYNNEITNSFCFYGAWNRAENYECLILFLRKVYPFVRNDLQFIIIGGGLSEKLKKYISKFSNIQYLGFVDDPVKELSYCQALIAPLRKGAGVKVKVIDALSSGTPVIGSHVAFEGIEDNLKFKLFHMYDKIEDYIKVINNWNKISMEYKQFAANEFYSRYNQNHFIDHI